MNLLVSLGIPAAITTAIVGLCVWLFKRDLNKRDAAREEREQNTERLMLLTLQNTRAISVLATATARAVQRIPDAKCNGDMTSALEQAAKLQQEENDFLINQGVKHIYGE